MNKFKKSFRGYNTKDVNSFLDGVITQVEKIVEGSKEKDKVIVELQNTINRYKTLEQTLNASIVSQQENTERIRYMAKQESDNIINESRRNANKIISDSLLRAEKVQYEAEVLKRNVTLFKRRIKSMLEQQMDLVDDMDKDDF